MSARDLDDQHLRRHPQHGYLVHPDGRRTGRKVRPMTQRDPRAFRLRRYLTVALAPPPPAIDHATRVAAWPMFLNNELGDCGPAGAAHQDQSWATYAGRPIVITDAMVKSFYFAITGGVDSGVYLEDMFAYWRKTGLAGDQIEAYVEAAAGDLTETKLAIQLFGSAGLGLSLPDRNTFGPWTSRAPLQDYGPPNPLNGHYVMLPAYDDARGFFKCATWGALEDLSYEFLQAYNDQTMVALNDLMILPDTGQSPEAFDFARLQEDLGHLGDPVGPVPDPPPAPEPGGCNLLGAALHRARRWVGR